MTFFHWNYLRVEIAKIKPREILSRQNREIKWGNKVCEILFVTDVSALWSLSNQGFRKDGL